MADIEVPFDSAVFERLLSKRIIVLGTEVNDESANRICAQLILLAAEDSEKDLAFWFSDKVLHPKKKVGGKPLKPLMLADLPPACKNVLDAPAKTISAGVQDVH